MQSEPEVYLLVRLELQKKQLGEVNNGDQDEKSQKNRQDILDSVKNQREERLDLLFDYWVLVFVVLPNDAVSKMEEKEHN